ncbi:RluA family pseudouridine synthase [Oceanobacillus sp. J11TS1]|uniref:RluA family pseudouridine synthase n=1 Tax=Oceanobacillus sp. J11TS1 TaxID=2807191 RepID=UPI001B0C9D18|nr:RluA family pseudouridine synthase [Oceanobacillus sp. J11TS1]GIO22528.1 pseudouridine synthase [Oceanobacillus sp. J11TS1]
MAAGIQKSWIIDQESSQQTVKDFLQQKQGFSRRLLTSIKQDGGSMMINNDFCYVSNILETGDQLTVIFPDEVQSSSITATEMNLDIVYEDEDHLVLNKPAGQASMPSMTDRVDTLANGIAWYYQQENHPATVHIVTRLDANTSGLVLVAKNRYVHSLLAENQKRNGIHRMYEALVTGVVEPEEGTISAPISRKTTSIIEREVNWTTGKRAVTYYKTIATFSNASLLRIQLETGRTHQIRVHFSHIGHPLLGDDLYGGEKSFIPRQALHCAYIEWEHPFLKRRIKLTCERPEDIMACMKALC